VHDIILTTSIAYKIGSMKKRANTKASKQNITLR
jgi:hypothetical protein